MNLNLAAEQLASRCLEQAEKLQIAVHSRESGATILDFGIEASGGLDAGLYLAAICMADHAKVSLHPAEPNSWSTPLVQVYSDKPLLACMASQYAGWPIQHQDFFAMGSGPMRSARGREKVLEILKLTEDTQKAVGVLECDRLPTDHLCQMIAEACRIEPEQLTLCVAPTRSLAGMIQVVARSAETCLHKLFELGFDLHQVRYVHGTAPLPSPSRDFAIGIGRTNDAILYGGRVQLWVESEDSMIEAVGSRVPSNSSKDWGRPFAEIFRDYDFDFYRVDPGLFSPAEVTIHNLATGRTFRYGQLRTDVLADSFGYC
jgi:methenyltetrahydromethanopterin cyclohydrolase